MIRNLLALVGLLGIALAAAVGLQAYRYDPDATDRPRRLAVSYAGLDLASPNGVRTLERRIDRAIGDVCDDPTNLYRADRICRENARAGVRPQVDAAIARAQDRAFGGYGRYSEAGRDQAGYDDYPPAPREEGRYDRRDYDPTPPAPPPPAYAVPPAAPEPRLRLVKRTVVTVRTVTTVGSPAPTPLAGRWHPKSKRSVSKAYAPRAPVANSWLPPSAFAAIDRATQRSFTTGKLTRWSVVGRDGYVSVSPPRRMASGVCRNVQAVKYAGGRQIVVADGLRCRDHAGRLLVS